MTQLDYQMTMKKKCDYYQFLLIFYTLLLYAYIWKAYQITFKFFKNLRLLNNINRIIKMSLFAFKLNTKLNQPFVLKLLQLTKVQEIVYRR